MSIIIAFSLAFVFRGFVVEAFVIPTGSMAPTLLGQHMLFKDGATGYDWTAGPLPVQGQNPATPNRIQKNVAVHDPMSGALQNRPEVPIRSGDRILVLKYLYAVFAPSRYDVVVFKNPAGDASTPAQSEPSRMPAKSGPPDNYIKRLIGLPGEHIALVDGDVFVRQATEDEMRGTVKPDPMTYWELPGWTIARKSIVQQRALWQPVFDTSWAPMGAAAGFSMPWVPSNAGQWAMGNPRELEYMGKEATTLAWDASRPRWNDRGGLVQWSIDDRYAYDEPWRQEWFPVSDLRMRAGIEPMGEGLTISATISAREHDFVAEITGSALTLKVREPIGAAGVMTWRTLGNTSIDPLPIGKVTNVEFWHSDQCLRIFIGGKQVLGPVNMDWSPAERIRFATKKHLSELLAKQQEQSRMSGNVLQETKDLYTKPRLSWAFNGAGVKLYRVAVDRDLHYRADWMNRIDPGRPAIATSPFSPLILKHDQFFCCGDNSPQSLDGRLWGYPDPWVQVEFGADPGVVPRDLLLGRAFFVYWPSLLREEGPLPVPDFGRMRFIW